MLEMSFFDEPLSEAPEFEEPDPQRVPWRGTSEDTIGMAVPLVRLLVRTEDVAIIVSGLVAYSGGFDLTVITIARIAWAPTGIPRNPMGFGLPDGAFPSPEFLRFGLRYADGSRATNTGFGRGIDRASTGVRDLRPRGSSGGGRKYTTRYWSEPLPPPGLLGLVCEWPKYGIAETEDVISAELILSAAEQAKPIWPEDVGIAEPTNPYGTHRASARARTFVSSQSSDS
jgi:hypothetical protein